MTTSAFDDPFLQSILENIAREEGFRKPKFTIALTSKPGNNYCGRIFRTRITERDEAHKRRSLSLVFKVSPLSKAKQERTTSDLLFRRETNVYQTVLPTLNKILNKYGVIQSEMFPGTAKCYTSHLDNESCQVLVLEDLIAAGFKVAGVKPILDLNAEDCRHILKKLALWHAATTALQHHEPEEAKRIKKLLSYESPEVVSEETVRPIIRELKQSAREGLELLGEPYKKGSQEYEKLKNDVNDFLNQFLGAYSPTNDLSCVIHGDCHFNNVLYKHDKEQTLQDVCFIDYQATRFGSPAVDIAYMIFICTTKELRDASYDALIRYYHSEVSSHLRKMDCDPDELFPWQLLEQHLKRYGKFGVLMSLALLPLGLSDLSEGSGIENYFQDEDRPFFVGRPKTSDPNIVADVSKRMTGVVTDAFRWGYI